MKVIPLCKNDRKHGGIPMHLNLKKTFLSNKQVISLSYVMMAMWSSCLLGVEPILKVLHYLVKQPENHKRCFPWLKLWKNMEGHPYTNYDVMCFM